MVCVPWASVGILSRASRAKATARVLSGQAEVWLPPGEAKVGAVPRSQVCAKCLHPETSPPSNTQNHSDISRKSRKETDYLLIIGKNVPQLIFQDAQQGAHHQGYANWKRQRNSMDGPARSHDPAWVSTVLFLHHPAAA